jgi:hypothetical protein
MTFALHDAKERPKPGSTAILPYAETSTLSITFWWAEIAGSSGGDTKIRRTRRIRLACHDPDRRASRFQHGGYVSGQLSLDANAVAVHAEGGR